MLKVILHELIREYYRLLIRMLTKEGAIQLLVIIFLEFISFYRFCAQSQSCYEVDNKTVCYFRPTLAITNMSWEDAWIVCKDHNATLPITENRRIEETLINYVQSKAPSVGEVWLAGREIRTNVWQGFNGKPFGRQSIIKEKGTYETNVVITRKLEYLADYPGYERHYICQCTDSILCQNKEAIRYEDGCIFVYNHETLNLVKARNRCLDKGGDLATFEKDEDLSVFQQNRSLLHESKRYWIGLRQNWWIWNETESNKEIKYSNWYTYENVLNKECLFLRLSYYKEWSQSSCTVTKPFICQRVITTGVDELDTSTTSIPEEKASSSGIISLDRGDGADRQCYVVENNSICYFPPDDRSINLTWTDAWEACKTNKSTLPVIESQKVQESLERYLNYHPSSPEGIWLAGKEIKNVDWRWLNGKLISNQASVIDSKDKIKLKAILTSELRYIAEISLTEHYFICKYQGTGSCEMQNAIRFGNSCVVVNSGKSLSFFKARQECLKGAGDLATFEEDEDLIFLQPHRERLLVMDKYWIGMRSDWWIWQKTDSTDDIRYNNFYETPLFSNDECLYMRQKDYKWYESNCNITKGVLCQTVNSIWSQVENNPSTTTGITFIVGVTVAIVIGIIVAISLVVVLKTRNISARQTSDKHLPTETSYQTLQHRLHEQDAMDSSHNYAELQLTHPQNRQTISRLQDQLQYENIGELRTPAYLDIISDH